VTEVTSRIEREASSSMTRYVVTTTGVLLAAGALLSLLFRGPRDAWAIWLSALVALAVQLAAHALGRIAGQTGGLVARMGVGALVRFLALVVYALLVALVFKLPVVAALISMAAFFFLTTLIEPLLTKS
jgi:hypothetical protein